MLHVVEMCYYDCHPTKERFSPSFFSSNDKNLCSKALLSGVKAFNKTDLEAEAVRSTYALELVHNAETTVLPHTDVQASPPKPHNPKRPGPSAGPRVKCEPGINVLFMQNRKLLGILHRSAVVNSTYYPCTCFIHPRLPIFLFSFPELQVCLYKVLHLGDRGKQISFNKPSKNRMKW